ncbi:Ig-like domain-containing protein [Aquiflexum sp.]|uniref:Ig-like domain-containing protein n=1 Tax=Aquiflexum sp. TaxID=1872584 RepID=UPI00359347D9
MKNFDESSIAKCSVANFKQRFWILISMVIILGACTEGIVKDEDFSDDLNLLSQSLSMNYGKIGISDAANEGIDEFYFLAPTVGKSPKYNGKFHPNLKPVLEISDDLSFEKILLSFSRDNSSEKKIMVNESEEFYSATWNTSESKVILGKIYRIRVRVGEKILGFVDIGIVPSPAKQLESGLVPVVQNQSFRIDFRIEDKTCPARIEVLPAEATILKDGEQQFEAIVYNFYGEILDLKVKWHVGNTTVASINQNGLAKGLEFGFSKISATSFDVLGEADLFVQEAIGPRPGRDVVVFNDFNIFDNTAMADPNNQLFVKNLINFSAPGIRNSGDVIMFDCGRNSRFTVVDTPPACQAGVRWNPLRNLIQGEGFTIQDISSTSGTLINIPENVKVLFLWLPLVPYTLNEINALKSFAFEGGRIIFVGEWDGFYTMAGINTENQFLVNMGAFMRNIGLAIDCGRVNLPETSLRPHPITRDLTGFSIACASVIELGPDDFPLFYDRSNTRVLAGVAQIDTNPITELLSGRISQQGMKERRSEDLDPEKGTGY